MALAYQQIASVCNSCWEIFYHTFVTLAVQLYDGELNSTSTNYITEHNLTLLPYQVF